jgi:hypothetical protein
MSSIDELSEVFGALIADINRSINKGYWFEIFEKPTGGDERTENVITLRDQTKLDQHNYTRMLEICGLVTNDSANRRVKSDAWEAFIGKYVTRRDYQVTPRKLVRGENRRWFLKLAHSKEGYNNASDQMNDEKALLGIRLPNLRELREKLQDELQRVSVALSSLPTTVPSVVHENNTAESSQQPITQSDTITDASNTIQSTSSRVSHADIASMSNFEIENLQYQLWQEQKRRANSTPASLCQFDVSTPDIGYTAIPVPKVGHKSTDAFLLYQKKKPYLKAFCSCWWR